jgi:recombination protein RecA
MMLCKSIEKKKGEGSIYQLGSKKSIVNVERWSTKVEDFDSVLGGGIPQGRMIEIFGPESSGKTSLAYHLASLCELCLFVPAEGTFDTQRAYSFGNSKHNLLVYQPEWGEDAMQQVLAFAEKGIPLIIVDSVPFLVPKAEYEKVQKDFEQDLRIGGVARLMTKVMPPIIKVIERTGTTIIFINQVRDKMDAMMFGEKTQTPGGHLFKHSMSIRIQIARRAWIEIPNKDPKNSAATEKIGMIAKMKIVKNKVANPFGECEVPMLFDGGFVSFDDVASKRKELMNSNRKRNQADDDEE